MLWFRFRFWLLLLTHLSHVFFIMLCVVLPDDEVVEVSKMLELRLQVPKFPGPPVTPLPPIIIELCCKLCRFWWCEKEAVRDVADVERIPPWTAFCSFCFRASASSFSCARFLRFFIQITTQMAEIATTGMATERMAISTICPGLSPSLRPL